jgi:hypothetical protein
VVAEPLVPVEELVEVFGAGADGLGGIVVERLSEPVASASLGIWRVRLGERSAVVKVIAHSDAGHVNWRSGDDVDHWYYWRREVDAYESGLLASLTKEFRAPDCFLIARRPDGSVALWIEDLAERSATRWGLERYEVAARHLGTMQGAFVVEVRLPDQAWLSRGWLSSYLTQRDGDLQFLDHAAAWRQPLVAAAFPRPPIERAWAMRRDQPRFLDALERLPRTLCHLDLHPANLFDDDGTTVAIDWSFVGIGAIGEDAGNLVADAVLDFHVDAARIDELYTSVATGYEQGLRDGGWDGPSASVRLGLAATIAAKYAWILPALLRAVADGRELLNRRPIEEAIRSWAPTVDFLLDRADEARDLQGRVTRRS